MLSSYSLYMFKCVSLVKLLMALYFYRLIVIIEVRPVNLRAAFGRFLRFFVGEKSSVRLYRFKCSVLSVILFSF